MLAKKGGLGSGLGVLFGDTLSQDNLPPTAMLPISKVEPREDQPRCHFDDVALAELTESIRQYGLIQPITVRKIDSGYYQIIAGERRWRAARAAGLDEVPVRIVEADDRRAMELALVENLQREDLNPIEEARGYRTLMEEYGLTQEETSQAVGKSRPAVANALRLLNLSSSVLSMVEDGRLSAGHARALVPIRDDQTQLKAAQTVIDRHLSARQTESLASRLLKAPPEDKGLASPSDRVLVNYTREIEHELENLLGRKVKLVDGVKKGHIELEFYGSDDRENLIENLKLFSSLRRKKDPK